MVHLSTTNEDSHPVQLVVDAKLMDIGIPAPKPGIIYSVSLMQYELLKVISGKYCHSLIFVGHHLPNLSGPEFMVDTKHRLYLTKEFPEHAGILDKYQTLISRTEPYYCLRF